MRTVTSSGSACGRLLLGFAAAAAAAGIASGPGAGRGLALPGDEERVGDAKCVECHRPQAEGLPRTPHRKLAEDGEACESCHGGGKAHLEATGNRGGTLYFRKADPAEAASACLECHREDETPHVKGWSAGPWARRRLSCASCHTVHADRVPRPVAAAPAAGDPAAATCLVCHNGAPYAGGFSHRALVEEEKNCASCHDGGPAHVAARGGAKTITSPARLEAAKERSLCLTCHRDMAAPKHFDEKKGAARCGDCHVLHGGPMPVRPGAPVPGAAKPGAETGPGGKPAVALPRKPWFRGLAEGGARFVGGDEGRFDDDIPARGGPRLFRLELEGGIDRDDGRAAKFEARLTGLGDAHEEALLRARAGDSWQARVRATRDRFPFVGGQGLHPGETDRGRLSGEGGVRLSSLARLGFGFDALETEAEVRGTLLDAGTVLPVIGDRDLRSDEAWASVDLAKDPWRLSVRQAFLSERGTDGRSRPAGAGGPGAPDRLDWDDDSTLRGPVTSATAGLGLLHGDLDLEGRVSRADLERRVDLREERVGLLGSIPFTRTTRATGGRGRTVDTAALEASLALGDRLAAEASFERRALAEDGSGTVSTTVDAGGGPVTTTDAQDARVRQSVIEEFAGLRWAAASGFKARAGAERWGQELLVRGEGPEERVRSTGLLAALEARPVPPLTVSAEARTARAGGAFTPLTAKERAAWTFRSRYADSDGIRGSVEVRRTILRGDETGLGSHGNEVSASVGAGKPEEFTADLGFRFRRLALRNDTLAFVGVAPAPGKAESLVRAHSLDLTLGVPVSPKVRATLGGWYLRDRGDLPLDSHEFRAGLRWELGARYAVRAEVRRRTYDERDATLRDYRASIAELALEVRF